MKTIVITGGNGDIAQSIKKELENEYIVLTPGKEELDVTDIKRVNEYFNSQNADILINNAGYVVPYSIGDCDIYSEKKAIDINLFGTFNVSGMVVFKNPEESTTIFPKIQSSSNSSIRNDSLFLFVIEVIDNRFFFSISEIELNSILQLSSKTDKENNKLSFSSSDSFSKSDSETANLVEKINVL